MIKKLRRYECASCGEAVKQLAWNTDPAPGHCGAPMHETDVGGAQAPAVHDDQLEGGPRRFETMGDDAPFLSTKSEWRREMAKRGLVNVVRHEDGYYRTQRKRHDEELRDTRKDREHAGYRE